MGIEVDGERNNLPPQGDDILQNPHRLEAPRGEDDQSRRRPVLDPSLTTPVKYASFSSSVSFSSFASGNLSTSSARSFLYIPGLVTTWYTATVKAFPVVSDAAAQMEKASSAISSMVGGRRSRPSKVWGSRSSWKMVRWRGLIAVVDFALDFFDGEFCFLFAVNIITYCCETTDPFHGRTKH